MLYLGLISNLLLLLEFYDEFFLQKQECDEFYLERVTDARYTRYQLISLQCHPGTDVTVTYTSCIYGLYKDTRYKLGMLSFGNPVLFLLGTRIMNVLPLCIGCLTSAVDENCIQTTFSKTVFSRHMIHGGMLLDRRFLYFS